MSQQKAIARSPVLPPLLKVITRPVPSPGKGEVLVCVKAAGLNPVDWKAYKHPDALPFTNSGLGTDIAGVVEAVGEGVTDWKVGDRLVSQGAFKDDYMGLQEFALATGNLSTKIPENITFEQASTVPVAFAAALHGLWGDLATGLGIGLTPSFDGVPHYKGQAALVIGGSSSVGQYAIQVLRLSGFSTIITYTSAKHAEHTRSLGATHTINRAEVPTSELTAAARAIVPEGVSVVFDAIAYEDTQLAGYAALAPGGKQAQTLPVAASVKAKKESDAKANPKDAKTVVAFIANSHLPGQGEIGQLTHQHLSAWLAKGATGIVPNRYEIVPQGLAGVEEAFARMERGNVSGIKLVVRPEETPQ